MSKQKTLKLKDKIAFIVGELEKEYGVPERGDYSSGDPIEELVLTILSQNTNDVNRDRAFASLKARFKTWEDVAHAKETSIEAAIRVGGLAEQKSRRIKAALNWIRSRFSAYSLEKLREMESGEVYDLLTSLEGVGPKTASIVLLFSLGRPYFPVDTHIHRVTTRLGLVPEKADANKAHEILGKLFPPEKYFPTHINVITHGRRVCSARKPKCGICVIRRVCPWPAKNL